MSDVENENSEDPKPVPENPLDHLQRQLQDLFRKANITVMPFMSEAPPPSPAGAGGDAPMRDKEEEDPEAERKRILESIRKFRLKPRDIKDNLDRYVIRQHEAKRAMAVAVCDHYNHVRRCLEHPELAEKDYQKQNVLLLGPTGVGKTHLLRTLARLIGVPFVKADATKFSETGYVGHDVEDMVRDLVRASDNDTELARYGIIYIDEVDKIASTPGVGKDVSGRGVQTNLLKLMEETDVNLLSQTDIMGQMQAMMQMQRGGKMPPRSINTRHILFIVSGAFSNLVDIIRKRTNTHVIGFGNGSRAEREEADLLKYAETSDFVKFGFEPEFIGRLPVRVAFESLGEEDLLQILEQAEDSILGKYLEDFEGYGIQARFEPDALREVARLAALEKTGARGLMTVLERTLRDFKFELPSTVVRELAVTKAMVEHPAEAIAALVDEHRHAQRGQMLKDVEAYADHFAADHGIRLQFLPASAEKIVGLAEVGGKTVHTVCERLFKDFPYGLKLILKHSGRAAFDVTEAMVEDPDGELSKLVLESYREAEAT
jgi:endopeptidase Clp ATP-binding regulatory subunit ClpX